MTQLLAIHIALFTGLIFSSVCSAETNVLLRESAALPGVIVYLGDVAEVTGATDAETRQLATIPLMPAPVGDSEAYLQKSEIRELLASRGVDLSQLQFYGANTVRIVRDANPVPTNDRTLLTADDRQQTQRAVVEAITRYLGSRTDHELWQLEFSLDDEQLAGLAPWRDRLRVGAGRAPWTGRQMFLVAGQDSDDWFEIRAQVGRTHNVVVVTRRLEQGHLIGISDIELRQEHEAVPHGHFSSIDQVLGMEVTRAITPDTILHKNLTRAPYLVQRGETVTIFARTGGISVRTFAITKQDGALGDLVQAETIEGRERFVARVSGRRQLEVLPTGTSTADVAVLHQTNRHTR